MTINGIETIYRVNTRGLKNIHLSPLTLVPSSYAHYTGIPRREKHNPFYSGTNIFSIQKKERKLINLHIAV